MKSADDILMPHTADELVALQQKKVDKFELLWPGVIEKTKEWMKCDYFKKILHEYYTSSSGLNSDSSLARRLRLDAPPVVGSTIGGFIGVPGSWAMVCDEWFNMITDMANKLWTEAIIDEC